MSANWKWPNGLDTIPRVTDEWGMRVNPVSGAFILHAGIDLLIADYWNRSAADGIVTFASYNGGAGNEVRVTHPGGTETRYKHNAYMVVAVGQHVSRGEILGRMGTTGDSTGDHLHFETRLTSASGSMNPREFMAARFAEDRGTSTAGLPGATPAPSTPAGGNTMALPWSVYQRNDGTNAAWHITDGETFDDPIGGSPANRDENAAQLARMTQGNPSGVGPEAQAIFDACKAKRAKALAAGGGTVNIPEVVVKPDPALLAAVQAGNAATGQVLAAVKALNPPG